MTFTKVLFAGRLLIKVRKESISNLRYFSLFYDKFVRVEEVSILECTGERRADGRGRMVGVRSGS